MGNEYIDEMKKAVFSSLNSPLPAIMFEAVGKGFQLAIEAVGNVPTLYVIRQVERISVNAVVRVFQTCRITIGSNFMFVNDFINIVANAFLPFREDEFEVNPGKPARI